MSGVPTSIAIRLWLRTGMWFAAIACILLAIAGSVLAANLELGSYAFTYLRPGSNGSLSTMTYSGNSYFARVDGGFKNLGAISKYPDQPPPGALGSANFYIEGEAIGFPERVRTTARITRLVSIQPTNLGPRTDQLDQWMKIVADAVTRSDPSWPRGMEDGQWHSRIHIGNFLYNAGWRLAHDPFWTSACLLLATVLTVARYLALRRRVRVIHNLCAKCAYDLAGQPTPVICPECGTPSADR